MTISKLRNALCLCLLGASLALPLPASAQTAAAPTANSIAERLQTLYPATRFGAVNTTPWPGVFEVVMGANLAYVDESGQYFLFGHLFDMKAQRDLTAERKDAQTRVDFAGAAAGRCGEGRARQWRTHAGDFQRPGLSLLPQAGNRDKEPHRRHDLHLPDADRLAPSRGAQQGDCRLVSPGIGSRPGTR